MAKKKRERAAAQAAPAIVIPMIQFDHLVNPSGELERQSAIEWLSEELPGYQHLIRSGMGSENEEGALSLGYAVDCMIGACVKAIATDEPVYIARDSDFDSWSPLRTLGAILGAAAAGNWRDFGAPMPSDLEAIRSLIEAGRAELAAARDTEARA